MHGSAKAKRLVGRQGHVAQAVAAQGQAGADTSSEDGNAADEVREHSALLVSGLRLLACSHGEKRAASYAASSCLLNDFAVVGLACPLGARESPCGLPLSDGLTADAELFGKRAKPNSFNGLSDWVCVHASQSN